VHQPLVDFQSAHVALVEQRIAADLDVVGAGRGVGEDAIGLEHADYALALAEHRIKALLQQGDRLLGVQRLGFVLQVAAIGDVVQVIGEHQPEVGERRVSGVEGIGCGAVEFLRDHAEVRRATRLEHADDHAVFATHAPHDLPDRIELAKLARDVALDILEFLLLRTGVVGQRSRLVISAVHRRQLAPAGREKCLTNTVVPLHRIEHAHRSLRIDEPIGQRTHDRLIFIESVAVIHPDLASEGS